MTVASHAQGARPRLRENKIRKMCGAFHYRVADILERDEFEAVRPMTMQANTTTLTPAQRWLVQRMHQAFFGTMHDVVVRGGEPVIDPPPKVKEAFKLGTKRNGTKAVSSDFALKEQHIELFDLMEHKQNGTITKLTIQGGLPFLVEWEAA